MALVAGFVRWLGESGVEGEGLAGGQGVVDAEDGGATVQGLAPVRLCTCRANKEKLTYKNSTVNFFTLFLMLLLSNSRLPTIQVAKTVHYEQLSQLAISTIL